MTNMTDDYRRLYLDGLGDWLWDLQKSISKNMEEVPILKDKKLTRQLKEIFKEVVKIERKVQRIRYKYSYKKEDNDQ